MNINIKVKGLDKVMNDFSLRGVQAQYRVDKVTEAYTRKMTNEAAKAAPVKTGNLRANLLASPRRLQIGTWEFGGTLPYTRRQEYEHKTKRGFIRKEIGRNEKIYRPGLSGRIRK